ncbi:hypothetical protein SLE2022_038760 [Rubroshorea leprosula]
MVVFRLWVDCLHFSSSAARIDLIVELHLVAPQIYYEAEPPFDSAKSCLYSETPIYHLTVKFGLQPSPYSFAALADSFLLFHASISYFQPQVPAYSIAAGPFPELML